MDQNVTVDNDLQKAIDDITQNTNADPVFSDPVAAPSSVPEGDTGELAAPVGPFPTPEPVIPEVPQAAPVSNEIVPDLSDPMTAEAPVAEPVTETVAEPAVEPVAEPSIEPIATPIASPVPEQAPSNLNMRQVKEAALRDLVPLLDRVNMSSTQKFNFFKNMLEELHDYTVLEPAYRAASAIEDATERAEALLYLIELIDKM